MRVFAISLGHCNPSVWARSAAQFYATAGFDKPSRFLSTFEHFWLDQHYPLGDRSDAHGVCKRYGIRVLDAGRNLGLHDGFNHVVRELGPRPGDLFVGYDPDSWPVTPGWLQRMVEVAATAKRVGWISLMNPVSRREMGERGFKPEQLGDLVLWETLAPVVNSICAWPAEFLLSAGGLREPLQYYGYLECAMWDELRKQGKRWVFIDSVWEGQELVGAGDPEYREWKAKYAHARETNLSFGDWLKTR